MMHQTLFVIGAGASQEVGLPIGRDLTKQIAKLLTFDFDHTGLKSGDAEMVDGMRGAIDSDQLRDYTIVANQMREAMPTVTSIDDYIDNHNGNRAIELLGKLAITRAILAAEKSSKLYADMNRQIDFSAIGNT